MVPFLDVMEEMLSDDSVTARECGESDEDDFDNDGIIIVDTDIQNGKSLLEQLSFGKDFSDDDSEADNEMDSNEEN